MPTYYPLLLIWRHFVIALSGEDPFAPSVRRHESEFSWEIAVQEVIGSNGCRTRIEFNAIAINEESNRYDFDIRHVDTSFSIIKNTGMPGDGGLNLFDTTSTIYLVYRTFDILIYQNFRYDIQQNLPAIVYLQQQQQQCGP